MYFFPLAAAAGQRAGSLFGCSPPPPFRLPYARGGLGCGIWIPARASQAAIERPKARGPTLD